MLRHFIKLDILTAVASIDSRKTVLPLLFLLAVTFVVGLFIQSLVLAIIITMQIALLTLHLPFRGEYRNMNALYVMLNVSSQTVIRGRYIYVFGAVMFGAAIGLLVSAAGIIVEMALGLHVGALASFFLVITFTVFQLIVQTAYLPILFMHGKFKLNAYNFLPQLIPVIGAFVVLNVLATEGVENFLVTLFATPQLVRIITIAVPMVFALAVYVSYRISCRLYSKREF